MANHSTQRQMEILDELRLSGSIRIQDLARRLDVSEETIRRNVRQMAASGLVLVGFLIGHLAGNLLIFYGPEALNAYGAKLRRD